MHPRFFKLFVNTYPPYWATGIRLKSVAPDYTRLTVQMKLHWYNRNAVGTHFGGSIYAMTDPFYMLMLIQLLGPGYTVWDKSAAIEFIRPGKGTLQAEFVIDPPLLASIYAHTGGGAKFLPELPVEVKELQGEVVARVIKTLYIRKRNSQVF